MSFFSKNKKQKTPLAQLKLVLGLGIFLLTPLYITHASVGNDLNQLFNNFFGNDDTPIKDLPIPNKDTNVPLPHQTHLDIPAIEIPENPTEENLTEIRQQIFSEEASLEDFNNRIEKQESELWELGNQGNTIKMQLTQLDSQIGINTQRLEQYQTLSKKWKKTLEATTRKNSEIKTEIRVRKREYEKFMSRDYIRNEHFGTDDQILALKWLFSQKKVSQILEEKREQRLKEAKQQSQLGNLTKLRRKLDAEEKRSALIYGRMSKLQQKIAQEKINLKDFSEGRANLLSHLEESADQIERSLQNYRTQKNEAAVYLQNLHYELKKAKEKVTDSLGKPPQEEVAQENTPQEKTFFSSPLKIPLKVTALFHDPAYKKKLGREHLGVDFHAPQGSDLIAPADGIVEKVGLNNYGYSYLILKHKNDFYTIYGHLSAIDVEKGAHIKKGALIGKTGGTPGTKGAGYFTTGPHLHLELFRNGHHLDPLKYFPKTK